MLHVYVTAFLHGQSKIFIFSKKRLGIQRTNILLEVTQRLLARLSVTYWRHWNIMTLPYLRHVPNIGNVTLTTQVAHLNNAPVVSRCKLCLHTFSYPVNTLVNLEFMWIYIIKSWVFTLDWLCLFQQENWKSERKSILSMYNREIRPQDHRLISWGLPGTKQCDQYHTHAQIQELSTGGVQAQPTKKLWHFRVRVMTNGDHDVQIFLSHPQTNPGLFFLVHY